MDLHGIAKKKMGKLSKCFELSNFEWILFSLEQPFYIYNQFIIIRV